MNPFVIDPNVFTRIMPQRRTRRRITIFTLSFCAGIIVYCLGWGNPENSLHTIAMNNAFILAGTIAMGYAMSAVADNAVIYTRPVQPEDNGTTPTS